MVLLTGPIVLELAAKATAFWLRRAYWRRLTAKELEYVIVFVFYPADNLGGVVRQLADYSTLSFRVGAAWMSAVVAGAAAALFIPKKVLVYEPSTELLLGLCRFGTCSEP